MSYLCSFCNIVHQIQILFDELEQQKLTTSLHQESQYLRATQ
jgi:hypothetical protein